MLDNKFNLMLQTSSFLAKYGQQKLRHFFALTFANCYRFSKFCLESSKSREDESDAFNSLPHPTLPPNTSGRYISCVRKKLGRVRGFTPFLSPWQVPKYILAVVGPFFGRTLYVTVPLDFVESLSSFVLKSTPDPHGQSVAEFI